MRTARPNTQLADVLRRVGCSNKGLAVRVRAVSARHGIELRCDHVTVKRWLDGAQPRPATAAFIAEALSEKAGYRVSLADVGMEGHSPSATLDDALDYSASVESARDRLSELTTLDLADDSAAINSAIVPAAWSSPLMTWLLSRPEAPPTRDSGILRVGIADVEAIRTTIQLFMRMDFQYGGGHARAALAQYFARDVLPLLNGSFTESTGQLLFSAAAEVAQLLGWTAYDLGRHGMAQRYLVQALRLAQAGGDRVMGGRILSNMSHQANYLGRFEEARQLARAAQEGAKGVATPTVQSMLLAMEARALAGTGDDAGCSSVLREAETIFQRRIAGDDPTWVSYFDEAELAGEAAHCFRDLRKPKLAQEFVSRAVELSDPSYVRTLAFIRLVHAASCLHETTPDPDRAVILAGEAMTLAGTLKSERYLRYVRDLCTDFLPFRSNPAVTAFLSDAGRLVPV